MVARVVHTCELEEADAWMWGVGSSIITPKVSFLEAQPTMLHQLWLSELVACENVVANSDSVFGNVHNCGSRKTSGSLGHEIGKVVTSLQLHILNINIHGAAPWYWACKSLDDGWDQRGWESDNVQASMLWAMRMASLNDSGP